MSYTIIKHCKMDWETETHTFTFVTGGNVHFALDGLGDLIGSLQRLQKQITEGGIYQKNLPAEIKAVGGFDWTVIDEYVYR